MIENVTNGHFGDHIFGPLPDISMNNHLRTIPIRERFKYWFESIGTDRSSPALEKEWEEISPKMPIRGKKLPILVDIIFMF